MKKEKLIGITLRNTPFLLLFLIAINVIRHTIWLHYKEIGVSSNFIDGNHGSLIQLIYVVSLFAYGLFWYFVALWLLVFLLNIFLFKNAIKVSAVYIILYILCVVVFFYLDFIDMNIYNSI